MGASRVEVGGGEGASPATVLPSWAVLALHLGLWSDLEDVEAHDQLQAIFLAHPDPVKELVEETGLSAKACARVILLASARPSLIAPQTGAWGWMSAVNRVVSGFGEESECGRAPGGELKQRWGPAARDRDSHDTVAARLIAAVEEATRTGLPPHELRNAFLRAETMSRPPEPGKVVNELRVWLERAKQARLLPMANRVLRDLLGQESEIGRVIESVLHEEREWELVVPNETIEGVRRLLDGALRSEEAIRGLVQRKMNASGRLRGSATEGKAVDQVVARLVQLSSLLWSWLQFVTGERHAGRTARTAVEVFLSAVDEFNRSFRPINEDGVGPFDGGWRPPWSQALQATEAAGAAAPLRGAQPGEPPGEEFAPVKTETAAARVNADDGGLNKGGRAGASGGEIEGSRKGEEQAIDHFIARTIPALGSLDRPDWMEQLVLPVLFAPDPPLKADGRIDLAGALKAKPLLAEAARSGRSIPDAFQLHLKNQDFLAARLLLQVLERKDAGAARELERRLERARASAIEQMKRSIDEARAKLEEATIYHALSEESRAQLDGRILSIEEPGDERIGRRLSELRQILEEIGGYLDLRRRSLESHIQELQEELDRRHTASPLERSLRRYLAEATRLVAAGDLALADEHITHVEQALSLGMDPKWDSVDPPAAYASALDEFRQNLERFAIPPAHAAGAGDVAPGLLAYQELKRRRSLSEESVDLLAAIFELAGFSVRRLAVASGERDRYHVKAEMHDGDSSPLPEFGAEQRHGLYDVVVIFGEPGQDVIGQTLRTLKLVRSRPIVLYVGRLSRRQRQDWSYYCRREGITVLLIDEALVYFLATRKEHRLSIAVSCGVAWGYANPYEPQGPVPKEMFKGRTAQRRDLVEGRSSFIYGGRQFGKSVLLSVVERELHAPERMSFAFYEDIRQIGRQTPASQVWGRIRQALVGAGLLKKTSTSDPERLVDHLRRLMQQRPELRIAFLFDEADAFLDADLRSDFTEVHRLKRIVESSRWRFRVIFAGLHSVQRFERLKNQPFAHLGPPVVVGPLDPKSAIALIQEPLMALGFRFDSRETLLRILSYTNYHPALIQLFCKELVNYVRQERDEPPYVVTREDVESLYLRPELRVQLVRRYEWTLDLDDRYRALVYAMIVAQKKEDDGYRREFTPGELWELAYGWWPQGFNDEPDDAFRSYLEELCGLGILMRMPSGKYRLRNGNVVRGLGSIETIEEKLVAISSRPAPARLDSHQLMLILGDRERRTAGPLTTGQMSELCADQPGVSVVLGSLALGLDRVPGALKGMAQQLSVGWEPRIVVKELPQDLAGADDVRRFLAEAGRRELKEGLVVAWAWSDHPAFANRSLPDVLRTLDQWLKIDRAQRAAGSGGDAAGRAGSEARACAAGLKEAEERVGAGSGGEAASRLDSGGRKEPESRRGGRAAGDRWARLVVLLKPGEIHAWMTSQSLSSGKKQSDGLLPGDGAVVLRRWTHGVIKTALADLELPATDALTSRILEVTGGWPMLLSWLIDRAQPGRQRVGSVSDLDQLVAGLEERLRRSDDELLREFLAALGVHELPHGLELLRLLYHLGPIEESELGAAVEMLPQVEMAPDAPVRLRSEEAASLALALRSLGVLEWHAGQLSVEPVVGRLLFGEKVEP